MRIRFNIVMIILIVVHLILISCEKPDISDDPVLATQLLDKSNDTIIIRTHKYFLEAELSRNLMPGGPIVTKRKLVAFVSIVNADSVSVSGNISITKLYVINGTLIWTSVPHESNSIGIPDYKLSMVSTDGPEWQTDIYVDVVAEVLNNQTKQKALVIKRDQKIEALY
jgi:hypothetical protein